jgi:hypothetical protein
LEGADAHGKKDDGINHTRQSSTKNTGEDQPRVRPEVVSFHLFSFLFIVIFLFRQERQGERGGFFDVFSGETGDVREAGEYE